MSEYKLSWHLFYSKENIMNEQLKIEVSPYLLPPPKSDPDNYEKYNFEQIMYDLDSKIEMLSSKADSLDYVVAASSGLLCAALDILWVGDFDLARGRNTASDKIDAFVVKTAKLLGCEKDDISSAVKFLEDKFPLAADGNTADFGGGIQHHLRDFAHHPTIVGLVFSLLTQFTYKSYGTDTSGKFIIADVPESHKAFIGQDVPSKILHGTVIWFFHLVSDMAGSGSTAGKTGGTGLPGPLLSLAKELSALPLFRNIKIKDNTISEFLSKLFNGTLFAKRDESGKIIKETVLRFDLRTELGIGIELGRQAIPVIANECIVRGFYFIRRFAFEIKDKNIRSFNDMKNLDWNRIKPANDPTVDRMLTVATGVFTAVDIADAVISQKYWVSVNFIGVGRFAIAIGADVSWTLKRRNIKKIKEMYENIQRNVFRKTDGETYERMCDGLDMEKFGLTVEQTEILYNIEYYKTLNDINTTRLPVNTESIKCLKQEWLNEWKEYISGGFSHFLGLKDLEMHWYSETELVQKIAQNNPEKVWFRLALLEAMLFEPYFPMSQEKDKKGNDIPSKKYAELQNIISGYKKNIGDEYLDRSFTGNYCASGYIKRLRKCYNGVMAELNEVLKTVIKSVSIGAIISLAVIATAGAFAPTIAVLLVGSKFTGLSGAALTSACLAYLGGGAIAAGGAGMAGGTIAIVGGGAALGIGLGAGVGGTVGAANLLSKKNVILQSSKLIVALREIFLNDEHDVEYVNSVYEKYVENIAETEKALVDLELKADVASKEEKKALQEEIKQFKEAVEAMKTARKNILRFKSSFETGKNAE